MDVENELFYSEEANANRYLFLKDKNDINFFVEDENKEYEYEEIFERLFGEEYNIDVVFGVGGKQALIKRFNEFGVNDSEKPSSINIYIADGDFDRLLYSDEMVADPHFIYLEMYNIETYYIDKKAVIEYSRGLFQKRKKQIEEMICFDDWENRIINESKKYYFLHCYVKKNFDDIKNVDRNISFFIDEKTGFKREGAYERYINEIIKKSVTEEEINSEINNLQNKYESIYGKNYINLICGKFLLHSLYCYLLSFAEKRSLDFQVFKWDLIRHFEIKKLDYIKKAVDNLVLNCHK